MGRKMGEIMLARLAVGLALAGREESGVGADKTRAQTSLNGTFAFNVR